MWMTGFDAPSVSTIYLDRPMRNHTLMQTIARANRVFPDKDNGLIVDYIGVFRNLEKALAIYGAANAEAGVDSPIQDSRRARRRARRGDRRRSSSCAQRTASTSTALRDASGFAHIALRDAAVEALLVDEETRTEFLAAARQVRKLFKALLPDPAAAAHQRTVAAIRVLAERIADVARPPRRRPRRESPTRSTRCSTGPSAPRSTSSGPPPRAASPTRSSTCPRSTSTRSPPASPAASEPRPTASPRCCKQRAVGAATRNPTRYDLVERIEELIAEYNAGSLNIDEYLRRLIELSQDADRRGAAGGRRRTDRGGAGDLRPAHQARTRCSPTPSGRS